jgi:hypothetical protein
MIFFVRTISIAPGKNPDAMAFAHKITKYIKDTFKRDIHISMPIGGNPNRIAFSSRYADLAEFESATTQMMADADYQKLVMGNAANVIPGSTHDEVWRTL